MENIRRRLAEKLNALTPLKSKLKNQRWTLFFVGDYGETVSLGDFKKLAILFISVILIVVVTMSCLFLLYWGKIKENKRLKNDLAASQKAVVALQDEKDVLMIRLVLAEKKLNTGQGKIPKKTAEKPSEVPPVERASIEKKPKTVLAKKTDVLAKKNPEIKQASISDESSAEPVQTEILPAVGVEDLTVRNEADRNTLKVSFVLKKADAGLESVAGRAFVLLKHDDIDQGQWFIMPTVLLTSGKPSEAKRGQYFSISRFKLMKFEKTYEGDLLSFNNATIFVFSKEGEILLEAEFPIEIEEVVSTAKE
jgi:hypothetical protein